MSKFKQKVFIVTLDDGRTLECRACIQSDVYEACEEIGIPRIQVRRIEANSETTKKLRRQRYSRARARIDVNTFFATRREEDETVEVGDED